MSGPFIFAERFFKAGKVASFQKDGKISPSLPERPRSRKMVYAYLLQQRNGFQLGRLGQ
jgi:hypothetical protein